MKRGIRRLLSVFTLVSRLGLPKRLVFEPDFSRADFWLPALGPLVSLFALAGFFLGRLLFDDRLLAVLVSIALQYWAFNLFHLDGLMDSADALLPLVSRERRLEILKDSRIGVYAFATGGLVLALRLGALLALARLGDLALSLALLLAPAAGRAGAALLPLLLSPARPGGLGALMRGFSPWRLFGGLLFGLLPLSLSFILAGPGSDMVAQGSLALASSILAALLVALLAAWSIAHFYRARLGGFTGDALGCAIEIGELSSLLLLAGLLPRLGGLW